MTSPRHSRLLTVALAFLALFWGLAILAAPPERTLDTIIRWVFAHASLTQVSLLMFLAAAVLAVLYLGRWKQLFDWMELSGWAALGLWLVGFLLSMIPARLSWGVWVDFGEPRTQMTLRVLAVGFIFVVLTRWVDQRRFTALAQLVLSLLVLYLNRSTGVIRHPFNPIGQSVNPAIPLSYGLIFLLALLWSGLLVVYLVTHRQARPQSRPASPVLPDPTEL